MAGKITVNGVTYDSVDAMPPNVRSVYEQTVANVPELADRDGDGIPDIVRSESISVRHGVIVHKKIVVNGTTYENEAAMPPDVRQLYERAMRSMSAGTVKKNVINLSFQVKGPGFTFRKAFGGGAASQPMNPAAGPALTSLPAAGNPMPGPIEPAPAGAGLRIALILGVGVVGGLVIWFLMRAH